jgi:hypothetical protein
VFQSFWLDTYRGKNSQFCEELSIRHFRRKSMDVSALQTAVVGEITGYGAVSLALLTASITLFTGIKLVKRVFGRSV